MRHFTKSYLAEGSHSATATRKAGRSPAAWRPRSGDADESIASPTCGPGGVPTHRGTDAAAAGMDARTGRYCGHSAAMEAACYDAVARRVHRRIMQLCCGQTAEGPESATADLRSRSRPRARNITSIIGWSARGVPRRHSIAEKANAEGWHLGSARGAQVVKPRTGPASRPSRAAQSCPFGPVFLF